MKILCPGTLDLLKDHVRALQIQESTHATYSAGICQPGICLVAVAVIDYCLTLSNCRISHPCPYDTHELTPLQ